MARKHTSLNRLRLETLECRWNQSALNPSATLAAPPADPVPADVDYLVKVREVDGDLAAGTDFFDGRFLTAVDRSSGSAGSEIELQSWSLGVTNAGTHTANGSEGGAGKVHM